MKRTQYILICSEYIVLRRFNKKSSKRYFLRSPRWINKQLCGGKHTMLKSTGVVYFRGRLIVRSIEQSFKLDSKVTLCLFLIV